MRFSTLAGVAAIAIGANAQTLPTISTKGSYFFTSSGSRWNVKGVAYQLTDSDPLLNTAQCTLDAALMKELGANAIRVYHVDGTQDHSGCMTIFANAGIYLFVDLDTFSTYITQDSPSWTTAQETSYETVMDEFQKYTNTAGFFIANEALTDPSESEVAVYLKAAVRDMKAYRTSKKYRDIPIGYSHADIASLRPTFQDYLACGTNTSETIDFFGLNTYEWCGDSSYSTSGYETLNQEVMNYTIPIFISETGCNTPEPRTFADQAAIFGSEMYPYWSGAIIYEWIQEDNHYGLITYGGDTNALDTAVPATVVRSGTPTPVTPDFSNLMSAWSTINPTGTLQESAYTTTNPAISCPTYNTASSSTWLVAGNVALPTLNEAYDSAVQYSITAGHLEGQTAATTTATGSAASSSGTASASATSKSSAAGRVGGVNGDMRLVGALAAMGGVFLGFTLWL